MPETIIRATMPDKDKCVGEQGSTEKLACRVCQSELVDTMKLSYHYLKHTLLELAQALTSLQVELMKSDKLLKLETSEAKSADCKSNESNENQAYQVPAIIIKDEQFSDKTNCKKQTPSRVPHQCDQCNRVLSSRSNLKKHLITHGVDKPFACDRCDSKFNQNRDLKTHIMQKHSLVRPHTCKICGKGFVHKSYLEEHITYHTGEKNYQCFKCGKRFPAQSGLNKHMKRHTLVKQYKCDICVKMFAVKTDLKAHLKLVHEKCPTSKGIPHGQEVSLVSTSSTILLPQQLSADTQPTVPSDFTAVKLKDSKPGDLSISESKSIARSTTLPTAALSEAFASSPPSSLLQPITPKVIQTLKKPKVLSSNKKKLSIGKTDIAKDDSAKKLAQNRANKSSSSACEKTKSVKERHRPSVAAVVRGDRTLLKRKVGSAKKKSATTTAQFQLNSTDQNASLTSAGRSDVSPKLIILSKSETQSSLPATLAAAAAGIMPTTTVSTTATAPVLVGGNGGQPILTKLGCYLQPSLVSVGDLTSGNNTSTSTNRLTLADLPALAHQEPSSSCSESDTAGAVGSSILIVPNKIETGTVPPPVLPSMVTGNISHHYLHYSHHLQQQQQLS